VITPIIMLVLLMAPYAILRLWKSFTGREFAAAGAGAFGLTLLFVFTGSGHFTNTDSMTQMLPGWVPGRVPIVYLTGILEFAIAAGFLVRRLRRLTGWIAAGMLALFFSTNVYAAMNHVPQGGHAWGPVYLLIRAPLQFIILAWVYQFAIKTPDGAKKTDQP
jgi:uncharacterized membrane protein